ncbi:hypothetical protein NCR96_02360 [Helicobacter sp. 14348-15]|uniref:hypothetical protein n=1 Tax=Helicobacter colisuis TaxID=2949739 RepID=UPI00202AE63C|nr:hypothetical protein [Helicobacter colisuis]MCL9820592.1 hypothetical protein [Helicobacter colisuis]
MWFRRYFFVFFLVGLANMWSFQDQSGEGEYVRVKTGFPYFDNKPYLTGRDILEAKELGIQLFITREEYLKRQADTYKRQADTDRRLDKIHDNFEALRSATQLILHSRDNAGFWNGLARWLFRKTGGLTPLRGSLISYDIRDFSAASAISRALADGDATYEEERESREVYLTGFRSAKEQKKVLRGAIEELLENISQNMEKIEFKFLAVGAEEQMVVRYIMYSHISKYLRSTELGRETFSYEEFGNMVDLIEMADNEWKKIMREINTDY